MTLPTRKRRSLAEVFAAPLLLALASIVGLVVGLMGEGTPDLLSWLLLTLPLAALLIAWLRRH